MYQKQEQYLKFLTGRDEVYQDLLAQCRIAEKEYLRILAELPQGDRELLERYISLCEELEYRRTCLAFCGQ